LGWITIPQMPRRPRVAPGGLVYHVLNRAVGRMVMFRRDADFEAFGRIMQGEERLSSDNPATWLMTPWYHPKMAPPNRSTLENIALAASP
jgi:hypothetical protein